MVDRIGKGEEDKEKREEHSSSKRLLERSQFGAVKQRATEGSNEFQGWALTRRE